MRFLLTAAALAAFSAPCGALACSCVAYPSAAEQLAGAELAFKGRPLAGAPAGEGEAITTFRVLEVLKGRAGPTLRLRHGLSDASCGVRFRPGAAVVVLAHRDRRGGWRTGLCSLGQFPEADYRRAARGEPAPVRPPPM